MPELKFTDEELALFSPTEPVDIPSADITSKPQLPRASALSAENFGGSLGDLLIRGAQSASFNLADNLADAVGLTSVGDVLRGGAEQAGEDFPIVSTGVDIGSGLLTGTSYAKAGALGASKLGLGKLAKTISQPISEAIKTATSAANKYGLDKIATPMTIAGVQNALFEAGLGADEGAIEALKQGAVGGATGAAFGKLGDVISGTIAGRSKPAAERYLKTELDAAKYDTEDVARAMGILSEAEKAGTPITLAEAFQFQPEAHIGIQDDPLTRKAKALYTASPSGRRSTEEFLSQRRSGSTERVTDALNEIYQTGTTDPILAREIAEKAPGRKVVTLEGEIPVESTVSDLFERSYAETPQISQEGKEKVLELAESNKAFEDALASARRLYRKEDPFSLKVLHATKKSITQDVGAFEKGKNIPFFESQAKVLGKQGDELGEILRAENPTFDTAMTEFANVAKASSPRAELQRIVNKRTEDKDIIASLIGTPENQEMIRKAIGDEGLDRVKKRLGLEKRALSGENLLRGNSTTAPQMLELAKVLGSGISSAVTSPVTTALLGAQKLMTRVSPQTQEEMLRLLMSTNQGGQEALKRILAQPERGKSLDMLSRIIAQTPRAFSER